MNLEIKKEDYKRNEYWLEIQQLELSINMLIVAMLKNGFKIDKRYLN